MFVHHDLVTPDGVLRDLKRISPERVEATIHIKNIHPSFVGYDLDPSQILFNQKSAIAQLGVHTKALSYELSPRFQRATAKVEILGLNTVGTFFLSQLQEGIPFGKLFAADERRRVRDPFYLKRMFGRTDRSGEPLLSLGNGGGKADLKLEKLDGRTVAFLSLKPGTYEYDDTIFGLIPTIIKALSTPNIHLRDLIRLEQNWIKEGKKEVQKNHFLLVRTLPLHIRTVFARVVDSLLPKGFHHTSASILEPTTAASGDIYELFGESQEELTEIPLEFYTLHPYREHIFFSDRDQLQACIEDENTLFKAMESAPRPEHHKCATFVAKGEQLLNLKPKDWIQSECAFEELPGFFHPIEQAHALEKYMHAQPSYHYLRAIEMGEITSQGILLTRHLPSPSMKRMLLSEQVYRCLKGIYFEYPSRSHGDYFSHEDRALLLDLAKFGISIYWLDRKTKQVLEYVPKPNKDSGMFVPLNQVDTFARATMVGIYGSNLVEGTFDRLIQELLEGLIELKKHMDHPLLRPEIPIALVTGGGPGVMRVANRVAQDLKILSCANIVDFRNHQQVNVNEQIQNPYIDAKMTYRLDQLVERQAEFHLDFPIFLTGGIGTDFEFALEEVRRKTSFRSPTPVLLVGTDEYWKQKITSRFAMNLKAGTISGSEWVSNCFYCVKNAAEGLQVYEDFLSGRLEIGPKGPIFEQGFRPSS